MSTKGYDWFQRYSDLWCYTLAQEEDSVVYAGTTFPDALRGFCHLYQPKALWMTMKLVNNFFPTEGVGDALLTARTVALTDASTTEQLQAQAALVNAYGAQNEAEQHYRKALMRLLDWRGGNPANVFIAMSIAHSVEMYLRATGNPNPTQACGDYFRSIMDFEEWVGHCTEGADAETPYEGLTGYLSIGEI